jgi:mannose-6-phosphate isomerase-like protein (cupin superfamily)
MGAKVREFMTHWDAPGPIWYERDEDELVGTQRSGGRPMPRIRTFDLFQGPTNRPGYTAPVVWKGEDGVIEVQNPDGPMAMFHRPADYDMLFFQFSGHAGAETEMGEFRLAPGQSMHLPAGVAYRMIGGPECRQLVVKLKKPVKLGVEPTSPLTETTFDVRGVGNGSPNGQPVTFPARGGKILEVTDFFSGELEPIVIERDHAALVGCATANRSREITVIPIFDYFVGMTGKGGARAPQHYESEDFRTDAYNTEGQQFGFHRGMDDDEIWFQFRGHATNETEWGIHELDAGEMGYVPRGIAHRITGGTGFLRYVLYFRHPMFPMVDASSHHGSTTWEVRETAKRELPAYTEARAKLDAAMAAGQRPGTPGAGPGR